MRLALGVLLLLPLTGRTELIFVDYEGTVSYVDHEVDGGRFKVGEHVEGRLIVDTAVANGGPWSDNYANYVPNAASYEIPYPGLVARPDAVGDGYDSYDYVSICNGCVADGAGGSLDFIEVTDDFFHVGAYSRDFIDNLSLEQSFDLTADDVRGPGESLYAQWGPYPDEAEHAADIVLSHLSMRPAKCFAPAG